MITVRATGHHQYRTRGSNPQLDAFGQLIQMNAHRHTLRETDPLERSTDIGQQIFTGAAIILGNAPSGIGRYFIPD